MKKVYYLIKICICISGKYTDMNDESLRRVSLPLSEPN